jgi:hypothetical protein
MRFLRIFALVLLTATTARAGAPTAALTARMEAAPAAPVRVLVYLKQVEPPAAPESARRAISAR